MGNCMRRESSMQWGGEDWASPAPEQPEKDTTSDHRTATTKTTTEVKIKVTKRQLEKLLCKVDLKELSVKEVLAQLMAIGVDHDQQRSWKPALQSIPE